MSADQGRASVTITEAGWYDCSVWPPRKLSDDEAAAWKPSVVMDSVYVTWLSEPFTGFASSPEAKPASPRAG